MSWKCRVVGGSVLVVALSVIVAGAAWGEPAVTQGRYAFLKLPANAAEQAAATRPAYSAKDPVGPTFSEAEKEAQWAAGTNLLERLRAAKGDLTIPAGDYRFPSKSSTVVEGLHDLAIDARGVTFWFERPGDQLTADCWGFQFLKCRNVTLRGLTVDYDPLLCMQGRVDAMDLAGGTIDMTVDPGFPVAEFRPLQIIFFRANGEHILQPPHFHDGVKLLGDRKIRVKIKTIEQLRAQIEDARFQEAFEGRCKIAVGDRAVLPFRTGTGFQIEQCAAMTLEDVTLYASPGFSFLESGGEGGHVYKRCRVIRRPGSSRLWAGNADAFHSRAMEKGSRLEACEFSFSGDDFLNFHGFWQMATHRYAANKFAMFPLMYEPFKVGQTIEFFDSTSAASQGEAVVKTIEPLEDQAILEKTRAMPEKYGYIPFLGKPVVVTLDRDVAGADGSLVDARRLNNPGIVVKDCYFHDEVGRGALLGGVDNITLENNTWRDCNGGIMACSCLWFYLEGPHSKGVVVRGNRFLNADAMPSVVQQYQPVNGTISMTLVANGGNYARNVINNRDLVVEDNTIYRSTNYAVLVAYTHNVTIARNRIIEPRRYVSRIGYDTTPAYYVSAEGVANPPCAIFVMSSDGVQVKDNKVEDPGRLLKSDVCFGKGVKETKP